ncbi:hypothetical protein AMTRI_Chr04g243820 [Amborella trichopoda]
MSMVEDNEILGPYTGDVSVDIHGNPVLRHNTGNWRACTFILGTECCEFMAFTGIGINLVIYLTKILHEGHASAARSITTWQGTCYLTPLLGAVLADAYWGRYWTIAVFSTIYFIPPFFNWFYFSINIGALVACSLIVWIQDNAGWALGFGIPTVLMGFAIGSLFSGTRLYRFQKPGGIPLTRMCQVIVASVRKLNVEVPNDSSLLFEVPNKSSAIQGSRKLEHTDEFKFLDKAATMSNFNAKAGNFSDPWKLCTVTQVEELKIMVRMFPIWATCIILPVIYSQISTMFVEQGMTVNKSLGSFTIPPPSLSVFVMISVIVGVPIYDQVLIPFARKFTGNERGFSVLQRMGIGLVVSIWAMAAAAIHFLAIPLYFLVGAAEVFTFIGQAEFFYEQSPDAMRSLCTALSLLASALGNYLNSFVLTFVIAVTTKGGSPGWIPNNLNEGHLDYFVRLLAGLSFLNLGVFVAFAGKYKCRKGS